MEKPKGDRVLIILKRWVNNEISTGQADRELKLAGVKLPKDKPNAGSKSEATSTLED